MELKYCSFPAEVVEHAVEQRSGHVRPLGDSDSSAVMTVGQHQAAMSFWDLLASIWLLDLVSRVGDSCSFESSPASAEELWRTLVSSPNQTIPMS